jgi:hypothetical protein
MYARLCSSVCVQEKSAPLSHHYTFNTPVFDVGQKRRHVWVLQLRGFLLTDDTLRNEDVTVQ